MSERHDSTFTMQVKDAFTLSGGRTVLAGIIEGVDDMIFVPGKCRLFKDGKEVAEIQGQQELFGRGRTDVEAPYAIGTTDPIELSMEDVAMGKYVLTGKMRMREHRDLIGIASPPHHFVPDRMTLGPRLPEGWDGDSWTSPDESEFFLRAWSKSTGRCATARGASYEEARAALMQKIEEGGSPVEIKTRELRQA